MHMQPQLLEALYHHNFLTLSYLRKQVWGVILEVYFLEFTRAWDFINLNA